MAKGMKTGGRDFKPGDVANPRGRPKLREEFKTRARQLVDELVLDAWSDEIKSRGDDWMKASELLTAYAIGKPSAAPEDREAAADAMGALVSLVVDLGAGKPKP